MKAGIHPEYRTTTIVCACGNRIETKSTDDGEIHVEICSVCHPFYTGKQRLVDTAGRVERFKRKYGDTSTAAREEREKEAEQEAAEAEEAKKKAAAEKAGKEAAREPAAIGGGAGAEEASEEASEDEASGSDE